MDLLGVRERFEVLKTELDKRVRKAEPRAPREIDPDDDPRNSDEFEVDSGVLPRRLSRFTAYVRRVPGMEDERKTKSYLLGAKAHEWGVPPSDAVRIVHESWNVRNDPPLPEGSVVEHVLNAYRYNTERSFGELADEYRGETAEDIRAALRNYQNKQARAKGLPHFQRPVLPVPAEVRPGCSGILPYINKPEWQNTSRQETAGSPQSANSAGGARCVAAIGEIVLVAEATPTSGPLYELDLGEVEYIGDAVQRVEAAFPDGAAMLLDAPMGSGKTYAVREATREGSLVALTALTALTHANAAKLHALPYTDPRSATASRVSTTLNSAGKIELVPEFPDDTAGYYARRYSFIDEAHEVADYWHQGPLKNRHQTFRVVMQHWASAKYPIAATANWTPEMQVFYMNRANDLDVTRPTVLIRARPLRTKVREVEAVSEAAMVQAFFADVLDHEQ